MRINWRSERGSSEPVAFLGLIPLILLTTLFMLQVSMFGYTVVVAESAVRDGARAAAAGGSAGAAVERVSVSTGIRMEVHVDCGGTGPGIVKIDLFATTPAIVKALQAERIHRWAVMQLEGDCVTS